MAPKAAAKKKKASTKAPADSAAPVALPVEAPVQWITLSVRLVTWGYLNFSMRLPLSARVIEIREQILARHGGSIQAEEVRIYKDDVSKRNLINDLMLTLEELDIGSGDGADDDTHENVVYYDFKPMASECPLLLSEPPNYRFAREAKVTLALEDERRSKEEARLLKEAARKGDKAAAK
jgi:hypothetical protein